MNPPQPQKNASGNFSWEWIPTAEFSLPSGTLQTTFKTRLMSFLHHRTPSEKMDELLKPESLEFLSTYMLDRLVPPVDLKTEALSLDPALMPWCEGQHKKVILILNVPHSGNGEILKYWAAEHGFRIIDPPSPSALLSSDDSWFEQFDNNDPCWVLPELEKCWLRHETGLYLIRNFFRRLFSGMLGFGVVGCGSWAWSFFSHALSVSAPVSLVAKPFDSEKLETWLSALASGKNRLPVRFRQADNGRQVLSAPSKDTSDDENKKEQSPFLRDLAAFCYGIPGVALAYWRSSLQAEPDALDLEKGDAQAAADYSTVWVKPWMNVEKSGLPQKLERNHAFVLHSLLLHDALDMDTLSKLLPLRQHNFGQTMYDLSDNGLIESSEDQWRVSAKGYPVVRRFLKTEGFLSDDFK